MNINLLKPIIPFLPVTIILIGLLNTITYYGYFGIHINDFISLDEVIILFADGSVLIILFLLIPFFGWILFTPEMYGYPFDQIPIENPKKRRLNKWVKILTFGFITLILGLCISGIMLDNYNIKVQSVIVMVITIVVLFFKYLHYTYYSENQKHLPHVFFTVTIFFLFITGLTCYLSLVRANSTDHGKYTGTYIELSDSSFVSDSVNIYVGKTKEYVFMHNKISKSNMAIPFREVKKIIILKRN